MAAARSPRATKDPELVALGAHLRALRHERSLTQEALADAAGLHWTYVGQIERGERNLTYKNLVRLAVGLGIETSALVDVPAQPVSPPSTG